MKKTILLFLVLSGFALFTGCDQSTVDVGRESEPVVENPGGEKQKEKSEELVEEESKPITKNTFENAEIVFFSPAPNATEVTGKTPVTILWDRPIFALKNPKEVAKALKKLITVTPSIEGSWQQLGTTGILFEPKEAWEPSTQYDFTIPFVEDVYSFETERPKMRRIVAQDLIEKRPLEIHMNQEISLKQARKFTFNPAMDFNVNYKTIEEDDDKKEDRTILLFYPKKYWVEDTHITVTMPNYPTEAERRNMRNFREEDYRRTFKTIEPFFIRKFHAPGNVDASFSLSTSTNISRKELLKHITVEPFESSVWEKYIESLEEELANDFDTSYAWFAPVEKQWKPGETYTVTISGKLRDKYGRSLGEDYVETFETFFPNRVKQVYFPNEWKSYETGVFPEYFVAYSGTIANPKIAFERIYPKPFRETRYLDWVSSDREEHFYGIDFQSEFGDQISAHPQGVYRVELIYSFFPEYNPERMRENRLTSVFGVGDFFIESKKDANGNYELWGSSSQQNDVKIDTSYALVQRWDSGKTFYEIKGPFSDRIDPLEQDNVQIIVGQSGDQWGVVANSRSLSPYDSGVSFSPWAYQNKFRSVGFSDRPLYRPGDTIEFEALVRELQLEGKNFPLKDANPDQEISYKLTIRDPQYNEVYELPEATTTSGIVGEWEIPMDATLGSYQVDIRFLDSESYESVNVPFYVTEYRKPDFLIESRFDADKILWKDEAVATIDAEYAFGGALSGKKAEYEISLFGYKHSDWWWGPVEKKEKLITEGSGILDEEGSLSIPVDMDISLELEEGDEDEIIWNVVTLDTTVFVSEGESSSQQISVPFYRSDYQVEVDQLPYFFQSTDEEISFSGTVKDLDAQGVKTKVTAELFRKKWARNDRKDTNGDYVGEWHWIEESVAEDKLSTDEDGIFSGSFARPEKAGEYVLKITTKDKKGREQTAKNSFYVWTPDRDDYAVRQNDLNNIQPLFLQQDTYEVGDRATILFPQTELEITKAHITLERGSVLQTLTPDIENQMASFEVEAWMVPNIFGSVVLEGVDKNGNVRVKWGAIEIPVKDPNRTLSIEIIPNKETYEPGETAAFEIRTTVNGEGTSGQVTLAVVDQTLLALKARQNLRLSEVFLSKLPLAVETMHTVASLVSKKDLDEIYAQVKKIKAAMENPFGGGAAKAAMESADMAGGSVDKPRGDFRDTAAWESQIQTDENGLATIEVELPDNLTTWNVWAVGSTLNNAFGEGETSFKTSLPMLVSPITPNFLRYGDQTQAGVLVRRNIAEIPSEMVEVVFSLEIPGEEILTETKTVDIGAEARVFFDVEIPYSVDAFLEDDRQAKLSFAIAGRESALKDSVVVEKKLVPPIVSTTVADFTRVVEPSSRDVQASKKSLLSRVHFRVFGSLLQQLQEFVQVAREANYGCSEQMVTYWTSRILQNQIDEELGKEVTGIDYEELEKAVDLILKTQQGGGFSFWPNSHYTSPWLTAHVLEFAPEFEKMGVGLPEDSLRSARDWLRKEVLKTCEEEDSCRGMSDAIRQYVAYVLLRDGVLSPVDLDFLSRHLESFEAKIWFAKSVWLMGRDRVSPAAIDAFDVATETIERRLRVRDRYAFWDRDEYDLDFFTQDERLTALVFDSWIEAQVKPQMHDLIARYLAETKQSLSGNTALRVLLALRNYQASLPVGNFPADYSVSVEDEKVLVGKLMDGMKEAENETVLEPGKSISATYESGNDKEFFVDMKLEEIHKAKDMQSISRGFWIERKIYDVADTEFENPVTQLEVGKNYRVKIQIITNTSHRQVVVEDTIVSGAEAVNFDLDNTDKRLQQDEPSWGGIEPRMIMPCYGWCQPFVSHQEFYYDKARFFVEDMRPGTHELNYIIRARLDGVYEHPAPLVKEMYNPEVMATGRGNSLSITRKK